MEIATVKKWIGRFAILGVSPFILFGMRFARNIILSRLLGAEEFGITVAIGVVLSLGELLTDVALDRFVMINNSAKALSTAHALAALRGILVAAILIFGAPKMSLLFGVSGASWSFAVAAAFAGIRGFANLSVKQIQRDYKYGRQTIAVVASCLSAIVVIFPAVSVFHDHRAIVLSFFAESSVYVLFSHLLAPARYDVRPNWPIMRDALSFGLPLTINGAGLAVIYQLDRTLVGYWFGVKELAYYAVVLSVGVVPTNLILGIFSNFGISYLLTNDAQDSVRADRYEFLIRVYAALSTLYVLGLALALDIITPLLFGESFKVGSSVHVLCVAIAFLRLQRGGAPTTLLLANGRTRLLAFANFSAIVGLLCAWLLIIVSPRLESILVGVLVGEVISFVLMFAFADGAFEQPTAKLFFHLLATLPAPIFIAGLLAMFPMPDWGDRGVIFFGGALAITLQLVLIMRASRGSKFRGQVYDGTSRPSRNRA